MTSLGPILMGQPFSTDVNLLEKTINQKTFGQTTKLPAQNPSLNKINVKSSMKLLQIKN